MPELPYIFLDQTISLCEECLALVETKIIFENKNVYYLKYCPIHKEHKTLVSTDYEYYKQCRENGVVSNKPYKAKYEVNKGCPYDCGLCTEHEQHTAMGIVEILDECNLRCPTCISASHPGAGKIKSISEVEKMFDTLVAYETNPDLLMISGGEPTIHPNIFEILDVAKTKNIKHIMLISNGVRIANDIDFVNRLKDYKKNFEIYLQFDSLNQEVLKDIRGENLSDIRLQAIRNLEAAQIHSTLICVVKKGVNEFEMNDVINFALQFKYIRGVTFQPCKITGRNDRFDKDTNYITLSEVREGILRNSRYFTKYDLMPHPLNPDNICIGYLQKDKEEIRAVTNFLYRDTRPSKKWKVDFPYSDKLKTKMYFLPELDCKDVKYENLFRVTIVSFLDKFNFCTKSVKQSCIHFITQNEELIPIDTYYLLYNNNATKS
jgi:uncharacterized radical SAM superfamily Fe-S cluster-containing enzyme